MRRSCPRAGPRAKGESSKRESHAVEEVRVRCSGNCIGRTRFRRKPRRARGEARRRHPCQVPPGLRSAAVRRHPGEVQRAAFELSVRPSRDNDPDARRGEALHGSDHPKTGGQVPDHARPHALLRRQSDRPRLRSAPREHPLAAQRGARPQRLHRRLAGRAREVQVGGRVRHEPPDPRSAQPDQGRPFDRRLRHDRLVGEKRGRVQRPRRYHRHQL